jgi:hypothetical protein
MRMPDEPKRSTAQPTRLFLFSTDLPPEEIARVINSPATEPVSSDDEVPGHPGQSQNANEMDDSNERVLDPSDDPQERELPPS